MVICLTADFVGMTTGQECGVQWPRTFSSHWDGWTGVKNSWDEDQHLSGIIAGAHNVVSLYTAGEVYFTTGTVVAQV